MCKIIEINRKLRTNSMSKNDLENIFQGLRHNIYIIDKYGDEQLCYFYESSVEKQHKLDD